MVLKSIPPIFLYLDFTDYKQLADWIKSTSLTYSHYIIVYGFHSDGQSGHILKIDTCLMSSWLAMAVQIFIQKLKIENCKDYKIYNYSVT